MSRVSLKDIASRLGVSQQTVSRALRGERYVRPELQRQIGEMADILGYRPDPRIKALLSHMRQRNPVARGETIAFIILDASEERALKHDFTGAIIEGARTRAERLGFGFETHALASHPNCESLERILRARGIELLIIGPVVTNKRHRVSFHWERYASVLIGPGIWWPRLNRVLPDYYLNMVEVLRHVRKLGYRRPALVMRQSVLLRAAGAVEASFRQNLGMIGLKNPTRFVFRIPVEDHPEEYRDWLKKMRIDVIISDQRESWQVAAAGYSVDEMGFISISAHPRPGISGINTRVDLLGAHAADLVAAHYYRNERGVPESPIMMMHEGEWQIGETTRVQPSKRKACHLAIQTSDLVR